MNRFLKRLIGGMSEAPSRGAPEVTEEAVRCANRLFLARDLENTAVIADKLRQAGSRAVRADFLSSAKVMKTLPKSVSRPGLHGDEPVRAVECDGPPKQLARLFAHVNASWQQVGNTDPYSSLLTDPKDLGLPPAEIIDVFFHSGHEEVRRLLLALERNGLSADGRPTCLEFSCGLERDTQALAPSFERLVAVDISPRAPRSCRASCEGTKCRRHRMAAPPFNRAVTGLAAGRFHLLHHRPAAQSALGHRPHRGHVRPYPETRRSRVFPSTDLSRRLRVPPRRVSARSGRAQWNGDARLSTATRVSPFFPRRRGTRLSSRGGCTGWRPGERSNTFLFRRA